jgi:hypothetical protein
MLLLLLSLRQWWFSCCRCSLCCSCYGHPHEPLARWLVPRFGIPSHAYCPVLLYCTKSAHLALAVSEGHVRHTLWCWKYIVAQQLCKRWQHTHAAGAAAIAGRQQQHVTNRTDGVENGLHTLLLHSCCHKGYTSAQCDAASNTGQVLAARVMLRLLLRASWLCWWVLKTPACMSEVAICTNGYCVPPVLTSNGMS